MACWHAPAANMTTVLSPPLGWIIYTPFDRLHAIFKLLSNFVKHDIRVRIFKWFFIQYYEILIYLNVFWSYLISLNIIDCNWYWHTKNEKKQCASFSHYVYMLGNIRISNRHPFSHSRSFIEFLAEKVFFEWINFLKWKL